MTDGVEKLLRPIGFSRRDGPADDAAGIWDEFPGGPCPAADQTPDNSPDPARISQKVVNLAGRAPSQPAGTALRPGLLI